MRRALPGPCRHPGCPAVLRAPYCPRHTAAAGVRDRERRETRPGAAIYRTPRWRRRRDAFLAEYPVCQRCRDAFAAVVHHRVPIAEGGDPWDESSWMALCRRCHGPQEADDRGKEKT